MKRALNNHNNAVKELDEAYMKLVAEYCEGRGKRVIQITRDSVVFQEPNKDGEGYELVEVHSIAEAIEKTDN